MPSKPIKKAVSDMPYNEDAEKACIGAIFLSKDACWSVISSLKEEDFFILKNRIIFKVVAGMIAKSQPVDTVTVTEELINIKESENVPVDYIKECIDSMVAISTLDFYMQIVHNQSVLRKFLTSIRQINEDYMSTEIEDVDDFLTTSKAKIDKSLEERRVSTFIPTKEIVPIVNAQIEAMRESEESDLLGVSSGYEDIDHYIHGFKKGDYVIVAARPSVGKTALCLNFAYHVAVDSHKPVGIFSLEMSKELLTQRLISISCGVSLSGVSTGKLTQKDMYKIKGASEELSKAQIFIDDTPGQKILDIVTKCRKLQASNPNLGMIIVDYLTLVQTTQNSRSPDSRQEEVRKISLAFQNLARELKIPVIVVSQLSRDVEKRSGSNKPMLSDLRDSGSLEQDADIVMLLYREDYYDQNKKGKGVAFKKGGQLSEQEKFDLAKDKREQELGDKIPGDASVVDVHIAKNRNGSVGHSYLFFYKAYGQFVKPTQDWIEHMNSIQDEFGGD